MQRGHGGGRGLGVLQPQVVGVQRREVRVGGGVMAVLGVDVRLGVRGVRRVLRLAGQQAPPRAAPLHTCTETGVSIRKRQLLTLFLKESCCTMYIRRRSWEYTLKVRLKSVSEVT